MTAEMTPAIERAERALVEAWHGTIGRAFHPTRVKEARATVAAALDVEEMGRVLFDLAYLGTDDWEQHRAREAQHGGGCMYVIQATALRTALLGADS